MYYPQELLEEIRMQNDIVDVVGGYIPLKQKGSSYFGLCPFHNEGTPSFSVIPDKQFYYCFGCGASGNVYSFIMQLENCDFVEAVKRLADRVHITLPEPAYAKEAQETENLRKNLFEIHKMAGRFYYEKLQSEFGDKALNYLNNRGILPNIQKKFGIGYAPSARNALFNYLTEKGFSLPAILKSGLVSENRDKNGYHDRFFDRLMFPIFDIQGRVIGFGGRILDKGEPKYLNSPETLIFNKSRNLYGLNLARASKNKQIIIVEGYMDMISIYQAGYHNVVASLGTAFNQDHVSVLKKFASDVILLFDSDEAGTKAALRAIPVLLKSGFRVKVAQVPEGKDPDGFIKQYGAKELGKLLLNAQSYVTFQVDCIRKHYNMQNTEHRISFTTEAAELLAKIPSSIEQDVYTKEVAEYADISEEAIKIEMDKIRDRNDSRFTQEAERKRIKAYSETTAKIAERSKGILEAQREILHLCIFWDDIYDKIKEFITAEDFIEPVYQKLAFLIFDYRQRKQTLFPAELMNHFETVEEQKRAGEVFAVSVNHESRKDLEKAVNEEIRLIKKTGIDQRASNATDIESIKRLVEERKMLGEMSIILTGDF